MFGASRGDDNRMWEAERIGRARVTTGSCFKTDKGMVLRHDWARMSPLFLTSGYPRKNHALSVPDRTAWMACSCFPVLGGANTVARFSFGPTMNEIPRNWSCKYSQFKSRVKSSWQKVANIHNPTSSAVVSTPAPMIIPQLSFTFRQSCSLLFRWPSAHFI